MNIYEKLLEKIKSILGLYLKGLSNIDRRVAPLNIYSNHDNTYEKELLEKGFCSPYKISEFSVSQQFRILVGLETEVDVSEYAHPEIDSEEMREIWVRLLTEKVNNNLVLKKELEEKIMDRGYDGRHDLDEFDNYQLKQILNGLELGVDVNQYAKPEFSSTFMKDRWKTLSLDLEDDEEELEL